MKSFTILISLFALASPSLCEDYFLPDDVLYRSGVNKLEQFINTTQVKTDQFNVEIKKLKDDELVVLKKNLDKFNETIEAVASEATKNAQKLSEDKANATIECIQKQKKIAKELMEKTAKEALACLTDEVKGIATDIDSLFDLVKQAKALYEDAKRKIQDCNALDKFKKVVCYIDVGATAIYEEIKLALKAAKLIAKIVSSIVQLKISVPRCVGLHLASSSEKMIAIIGNISAC